jgi:5-methylcytosine-specific restriction endonuclease McrA
MSRWPNERRRNPWAGSTRKSRLPVDWERLRAVVLQRCSFRCEWNEDGSRCPYPATDVDHITPGDDHSLANLQGLCAAHHLTKTGREAKAVQLKRKKLERLPEEKQPGVIDGPPTPTEHRGF